MNVQLLRLSMSMCVAGASIHLGQRSGRHLVAFEKDFVILNTMLVPLRDLIPFPLIGGSQSSNIVAKNDEEHVQNIQRKSLA